MTEILKIVPKTTQVAKPDEPDPEIVERLEELLDRARKGEIAAIAYAVIEPGPVFGTGWIGGHGTRDRLSTAIAVLAHRYTEAVIGGD